MDIFINDSLTIPERELRFTASRSCGPGGQHVNKVNSRLSLQFNVQESPSLTVMQKSRITSSLSTRITSSGILRLDCQKHRTQSMNRAELIARFVSYLKTALTPRRPRVATRISKAVKERRIDQKKRRGQIKKKRSSSLGMDE